MPLLRIFPAAACILPGRFGLVGFRMNEVMLGPHRFAGHDRDLSLLFHLTWGHRDLSEYGNPFSGEFLRASAEGIITVGGLVHKAECRGSLALRYFRDGRVCYELDFADEEGRAYRYTGEKRDIRPWNLHRSHTTCYGEIVECGTGRVVSTSVVHFPLHELAAFLKSFRLVFSGGPDSSGSRTRERREREGKVRPAALSAHEARILAAMASGIIPRGGPSFALGAEDLEDKWLPRTGRVLSRMPLPTRLAFRLSLHLFDLILPAVCLKRAVNLTGLSGPERTRLFGFLEHAPFPGPYCVLMAKLLIFPAFYGLPEVKEAVGYRERFPNPSFEGIKD